MFKQLFVFAILILSQQLYASNIYSFYYDESYVEQQFYELNQLEIELEQNNYNINAIHTTQILNNLIFMPDSEGKTAGDSFFKGFTLGCIGVIDAYLEDDRNKYKRGPLWTGCCLNTLVLIGLIYLLDTNYFHLIPGS